MAKQTERKEKAYGPWDKAWHPLVGCRMDLPCAERCWARRTMARVVECQRKNNQTRADFYAQALMRESKGENRWSGKVFLDPAHLLDPLRWRNDVTVATGFHGDWALLDFLDIIRMWRVMANSYSNPRGEEPGQQTFFLLSKRTENLPGIIAALKVPIASAWERFDGGRFTWPLPNVRIGTSASTQPELDARMEPMMKLQAAGWRTFLMLEPLLGPVDVSPYLPDGRGLDLVIVGGESGHGARPMHPDWARAVRDACVEAGVPFTFKGWGNWIQFYDRDRDDPDWCHCPKCDSRNERYLNLSGGCGFHGERVIAVRRVGKRSAGRLLDGRTWDGEIR